MEYVIVSFPKKRTVFVDGRPAGKTNQPISVPTGTHEFTLGTPTDYKPAKRLMVVTNTSSASPATIEFET